MPYIKIWLYQSTNLIVLELIHFKLQYFLAKMHVQVTILTVSTLVYQLRRHGGGCSGANSSSNSNNHMREI
jgi:hypothetical protein